MERWEPSSGDGEQVQSPLVLKVSLIDLDHKTLRLFDTDFRTANRTEQNRTEQWQWARGKYVRLHVLSHTCPRWFEDKLQSSGCKIVDDSGVGRCGFPVTDLLLLFIWGLFNDAVSSLDY
jgi:hypothetical protein